MTKRNLFQTKYAQPQKNLTLHRLILLRGICDRGQTEDPWNQHCKTKKNTEANYDFTSSVMENLIYSFFHIENHRSLPNYHVVLYILTLW